jgi:thiamine-phosphate pyrophosphorylase
MRIAPVYPIVEDARWIERLLPAGVRWLQLRIKERPLDVLRAEIRSARALCAAAGAELVVNDYWQLAIEERSPWVHLGQGDLAGADLLALRRARVRIGISTHSEEELERALGIGPDYIALGPIYPTLLKQMPWAPQGLARITQWKRRIGSMPLVAIGGLTLERLAGVYAAGADCAAVVTDIVRHAHPEQRIRAWVEESMRLAAPASGAPSREAHTGLDPGVAGAPR